MKLYDELISLEIFEGFEIECALHEVSFSKEEIRNFVENEVLNIYKSVDEAKKDITFIEIFEGPVIYFQTRSKDKARYMGYNGNTYRVKSGIDPETIKKGLNFFNIVKFTCKELGLTQKELSEKMGLSETTLTNWARGATPIPEWGIKMLNLLKKERKLDTIINLVKNEIE